MAAIVTRTQLQILIEYFLPVKDSKTYFQNFNHSLHRYLKDIKYVYSHMGKAVAEKRTHNTETQKIQALCLHHLNIYLNNLKYYRTKALILLWVYLRVLHLLEVLGIRLRFNSMKFIMISYMIYQLTKILSHQHHLQLNKPNIKLQSAKLAL